MVSQIKNFKAKAIYINTDIYSTFKKAAKPEGLNAKLIELVEKYLSGEIQISDEIYGDQRIQSTPTKDTHIKFARFPDDIWSAFTKYNFLKDRQVSKTLAALMLSYVED